MNYASKKQGVSFNQSAVIAKVHMRQEADSQQELDAREDNWQFVFRCGLSLNREMEFSSQQAVGYVMSYGDCIKSHTYCPIYWSTVVCSLKQVYPELKLGDTSEDYTNVSIINLISQVFRTKRLD